MSSDIDDAAVENRLRALLGSGSVPVLPAGTDELLQLLRNPDVPMQELAETLARFPAIVARLMALANSPWSAPLSPVTSLQEASSRLGIAVVRSVSIALTVAAPFRPHRCPEFDAERYWCCSLLAADAASMLCRATNPDDESASATARTASLIGNLGLLWMADRMPGETGAALRRAGEETGVSVDAALSDACGFGHKTATEWLGKAWNLPDAVLTAICGTRTTGLGGVVGLANKMVSDVYRDPAIAFDAAMPTRFGVDADPAQTVHLAVCERLPRMTDLAKSLFAAR